MPAYKAPQHFPGVGSLPPMVQTAVEGIFPPNSIPMPETMAIPGAGGAMVPPGSMVSAKQPIFRGANDVAKILKPEVNIPSAPNTGAQIGSAFSDYLSKAEEILKQRLGPLGEQIFQRSIKK